MPWDPAHTDATLAREPRESRQRAEIVFEPPDLAPDLPAGPVLGRASLVACRALPSA